MERLILSALQNWRQEADRKPLILQGVRQTGKTYTLQQFGERHFARTHYVNFEIDAKAATVFQESLDPLHIIENLNFFLKTTIDIQRDLVIFDEIQACPRALTSLKYFAEKLPALALCTAGSLLGLYLNEAPFPVGKVDFLTLHPMTFIEFLQANQDHQALEVLHDWQSRATLPTIVHEHLWQQFKIYLITGGLPEVVRTYIQHKAHLYDALTRVRKKQQEIIYGYYADIAKHAGKVNAMHIDRLWRAIPSQLAQAQEDTSSRFQFKGIVTGIDRYQRLANVIDWLLAAKLIIKVPIVEHIELPLSAYTKESYFKLYIFDTGILGALADLSPQTILEYDYGTYKGYVAENFIAQALLATGIATLYSWKHNRAEVEFLVESDNKILPIEVKSGWVTRSKSLQTYAEKYAPPYRIIFSAKNLQIDTTHQCHHYPLYLASFLTKQEI